MQTGEAIIYVAGNPDLYPLEYYDPESQTYEGAIPSFLRQFASEYGYDLRYYQPGEKDQRKDLAEKQQVDLVSGCAGDNQYAHMEEEPLLLFPAVTEGEETVYFLSFTDVAPSSFQADLREYAAQRSQAEWSGSLLEAAGEGAPQPGIPTAAMVGIGIIFLLLVLGLLSALVCLKRERKKAKEILLNDPETGLRTYEYLDHTYPRLIQDQNRPLYYLVCFHLDLDHVGYFMGQEQAKAFWLHGAQALKEAGISSDILAKGSDGELIAVKMSQNQERVERWVRAVLQEIRSFSCDGRKLSPSDAVAGICPLKVEYRDLGHALFHTRQCALKARREETDCRFCDTKECKNCQERWQLLADFEGGLERKEIQLYLQFFVDAHSYRVVGGEALSRWNHPVRGLLMPDHYVPLLEKEGRIENLDFYGMEKVCVFLEGLEQQEIHDFFISCNFSRRTLASYDFTQRFTQILQNHTFPRKLLILEVTESEWIDPKESEQMLRNIMAVRDLGVRVIFDDFGIGFSSFHDLQEYPMDGLKLDKHLIDNMWTAQGKIILNALVQTGHSMELTILAEGVEDDKQIEILQSLNCDVLQGFRFFVPMPASNAMARILDLRQQA